MSPIKRFLFINPIVSGICYSNKKLIHYFFSVCVMQGMEARVACMKARVACMEARVACMPGE